MRTLGRKVQVVDLFRFPTVRTLARHLVAGQETAAGAAGRRKAAARKNLRGARARTGEGGHD